MPPKKRAVGGSDGARTLQRKEGAPYTAALRVEAIVNLLHEAFDLDRSGKPIRTSTALVTQKALSQRLTKLIAKAGEAGDELEYTDLPTGSHFRVIVDLRRLLSQLATASPEDLSQAAVDILTDVTSDAGIDVGDGVREVALELLTQSSIAALIAGTPNLVEQYLGPRSLAASAMSRVVSASAGNTRKRWIEARKKMIADAEERRSELIAAYKKGPAHLASSYPFDNTWLRTRNYIRNVLVDISKEIPPLVEVWSESSASGQTSAATIRRGIPQSPRAARAARRAKESEENVSGSEEEEKPKRKRPVRELEEEEEVDDTRGGSRGGREAEKADEEDEEQAVGEDVDELAEEEEDELAVSKNSQVNTTAYSSVISRLPRRDSVGSARTSKRRRIDPEMFEDEDDGVDERNARALAAVEAKRRAFADSSPKGKGKATEVLGDSSSSNSRKVTFDGTVKVTELMGNKVLGFHALREKAMASSSSSAPNRATGSSSIMPRPSAGSIIDIDTPQKEFPVRGPVQYLDPVPPLPRAPPAQIIVKKKQPRQKKMWTQVEVDALERGLAKYGCGWREILYDIELGDILVNRSNVQLKDKARSEKERRIRNREALGVWEVASMGHGNSRMNAAMAEDMEE